MFYHRFWSVSEFIRVWCFNGNLINLLDALFLVKRLFCVIYRFVLDLTSPIFLSSPIRCWQDLIPSINQARRGLRSGQVSYECLWKNQRGFWRPNVTSMRCIMGMKTHTEKCFGSREVSQVTVRFALQFLQSGDFAGFHCFQLRNNCLLSILRIHLLYF